MTSIFDSTGINSTEKPALYRHRYGRWLPRDHGVLRNWTADVINRTRSRDDQPLDPLLAKFEEFILRAPLLRMLANKMLTEVPITPPYNSDPTRLEPQIRSIGKMFETINVIMSEGPQWYDTHNPQTMGLIGFPINAILDWPMGTSSGHAFFVNPEVNAFWKAILNKWAAFLTSPASAECLNTKDGWLSPDACNELAIKGNNGSGSLTFQQLFKVPDPSDRCLGFKSWDEFFLREFQDDVRPIVVPDDKPCTIPGVTDPTSVLTVACESCPYRLQKEVQLYDAFWLKSQRYSLADMLHGAHHARPFVGGTVYQAFLSALSYHRWHAPVSGKVVSVELVPGTYYSECFFEGFNNPGGPDRAAPDKSQAYIAEVAARGILKIEADNPKIGLMAMVFIGMSECSSCEFYIKPGDRITKGHQIGCFHFGGSTHCMIFRPETNIVFDDPGPYDDEKFNKKLGSVLAIVH
ncbi:MAG: hypothetical protein M1828_001472 [Chrysothrix sp. TS-e1954]|nr:MAG: hypothetical protein M1828_001472 [Chrysothrix sp. TS-e1954]